MNIDPMMDNETLLDLVVHAMEDRKAFDIRVLDVSEISSITDAMVIASGNSDRQVIAIANHVVEEAKNRGQRPLGLEGNNEGQWVLVDLGDVVAHVMLPQVRDFYQLEKLWSDMGGRKLTAGAA